VAVLTPTPPEPPPTPFFLGSFTFRPRVYVSFSGLDPPNNPLFGIPPFRLPPGYCEGSSPLSAIRPSSPFLGVRGRECPHKYDPATVIFCLSFPSFFSLSYPPLCRFLPFPSSLFLAFWLVPLPTKRGNSFFRNNPQYQKLTGRNFLFFPLFVFPTLPFWALFLPSLPLPPSLLLLRHFNLGSLFSFFFYIRFPDFFLSYSFHIPTCFFREQKNLSPFREGLLPPLQFSFFLPIVFSREPFLEVVFS